MATDWLKMETRIEKTNTILQNQQQNITFINTIKKLATIL